jgi:hypothetical protein
MISNKAACLVENTFSGGRGTFWLAPNLVLTTSEIKRRGTFTSQFNEPCIKKRTIQVQTIYVDSIENEKFLRNEKAKVKLKREKFLFT